MSQDVVDGGAGGAKSGVSEPICSTVESVVGLKHYTIDEAFETRTKKQWYAQGVKEEPKGLKGGGRGFEREEEPAPVRLTGTARHPPPPTHRPATGRTGFATRRVWFGSSLPNVN